MSERKVTTDALETLGTVLTGDPGRDAIHLAVLPAVAGHQLRPGDHVGRLADGRWGHCSNTLGIVDPFLIATVAPGEQFWLVVYPRQITSLRHVWEHPEFPEGTAVAVAPGVGGSGGSRHPGEARAPAVTPAVAKATDRIAEIASGLASSGSCEEGHGYGDFVPMTYERLMAAAERWLEPGKWSGYTTENGNDSWRDSFLAVAYEFWDLYEIVTGRRVDDDKKQSFFSCTC